VGVSWLELAADVLTLASVVLTVLLRKSLYPVGIAATAIFFFVFWNARLYASAGLQVYFTVIQLYGWWFWRRGDRGREPPIGDWPWSTTGLFAVAAGVFTLAVSSALDRFTDARSPVLDTTVFAASVLAQFLLDRKQMKTWAVWAIVDLLSIVVYGGQKLWLTTGLYVLLLANAGIGWAAWRKARARESGREREGPAALQAGAGRGA
jgi:nicotinamide mononucleotide transporter